MSEQQDEIENKQRDHLNFIVIPTVFYDYWMRVLNAEEFKILNWFARKTYAFTTDFDFSLEELVNSIGISEEKVLKSLHSIAEQNIIIKIAADFHRHRREI